MNYIKLAQPCRNFCILGADLIEEDPRDKNEKYAITTYVAGGIGRLILIDTHTFESESYDFPGDEGAWAVMYLKDLRKLILGTCATKGLLHCFDLTSRSFEQTLQAQKDTYLWNFARAKDGKLYAGTFPGSNLLQYDPITHSLESVGRVSDNKDNLYTRPVYTNADGNILVNSGYSVTEAYLYHTDTKHFTRFGDAGDSICGVGSDYILVKNEDYYKFYDPFSLELLETTRHKEPLANLSDIKSPTFRNVLAELVDPPYTRYLPGKTGDHIRKLADGRRIGIKGQDLFILDGEKATFIKIPAPAPVTGIMTISADENGILWGSCEFGQTIFSYDPVTGKFFNTSAVANAGGEVYGITHRDHKLYLTSYVGGDHIVYDPSLEWNQHGNQNPKILGSTSPDMVRPHGKSVLGPDGNVWTGWCASYGVYGGGISRINTQTGEVSSWFQIIPEQAIEHITSGTSFLYAVTSGEASGLSPKEDGYYLIRLDTDCNIRWEQQFELGICFKRVAIAGDYLLVSMIDRCNHQSGLLVYQEESMQLWNNIIIGTFEEDSDQSNMITELISYDSSSVIAFTYKEALHIEIPSGTILSRCLIEGPTQTATIDRNHNVYFAVQKNLYQLLLP